MRLETDVRDWVRELEMFQYWNGLYILMVAGIIVIIISLCGCSGALTNNISLLTIVSHSVGFPNFRKGMIDDTTPISPSSSFLSNFEF